MEATGIVPSLIVAPLRLPPPDSTVPRFCAKPSHRAVAGIADPSTAIFIVPPVAAVPLPPTPGVVGLTDGAVSLAVGVGDPAVVSEVPSVLDVEVGLATGVCSLLAEDELPEGGSSGAAVHAASPINNPRPHTVEIPSFQLLLIPPSLPAKLRPGHGQ